MGFPAPPPRPLILEAADWRWRPRAETVPAPPILWGSRCALKTYTGSSCREWPALKIQKQPKQTPQLLGGAPLELSSHGVHTAPYGGQGMAGAVIHASLHS